MTKEFCMNCSHELSAENILRAEDDRTVLGDPSRAVHYYCPGFNPWTGTCPEYAPEYAHMSAYWVEVR